MSIWQEILQDLKAALTTPAPKADTAPPLRSVEEAPQPERSPAGPVSATEATEQPTSTPPMQPAATQSVAPKPAARRLYFYIAGGIAGVLVLILAAALWFPRGTPSKRAPSEDVLAAYTHPRQDDDQTIYITRADLDAYLARLSPVERQAIPATVEGYRATLEQLMVDHLLWDWLLGRMGPDSVRQMVFDVTAGRYPVSALAQVVAAIPISESDIQQYYEDHPDRFPERTLSEVHDEIAELLRQQRKAPYIESYIADLRSGASVIEHPQVLAVPEPDERAMQAYYQEHLEDYTQPRMATVDWLRFRRSDAARQEADAAHLELQQGQDFAAVGQAYARFATLSQDLVIAEGERGAEFDRVVFELKPNELSPVFDGGDAYYVVRVKQTTQEPTPAYNTVKDEIRNLMWHEAAEEWFKTRRVSPVFVFNGWIYRAGDFYEGFKALPADRRADYHSGHGLQDLMDRTIAWLVVVEDARRQGYPPEGQGDIGTRLLLLTRATGTEDAINLDVSDEKVLEYYNQHTDEFIMPTRFKIRYIAIEPGPTDTEKSRAWTQAQEAYARLLQSEGAPSEAEFLKAARLFMRDPESGNLSDWIIAARPEDTQVIDTGEGLITHPLYESLLDLHIGDIAPPFDLDGTLYIVQVWDREEEHQLDLWQATNYLGLKIGAEKAQNAAEELSRQLLEQAHLVVYKDNLEAALPHSK